MSAPNASANAKTPPREKGLYDFGPKDADLPADIVINAGSYPIVIGSPNGIPNDNPRMDPGDRRRGEYYVKLVETRELPGIQFLRVLSVERARALEKLRKQRTGEIPPDWVSAARARAEAGEGPPAFSGDRRSQVSDLQRAAGIATTRPE